MSGVEPAAADSVQHENDAHQLDVDQPAAAEEEKEEKQATPPAESEQPPVDDLASSEEEDQPTAEEEAEAEKDKLETLQVELEQLQAQASEYLDGWQRARAEFANYKKRVEVEREELRRFSNETLLLKLLPVVDDFERAFQTLPEDLADNAWVNGITMILRKLQSVLETENVTPIQAAGQPFDPQWHQAIVQEETTEHPDGYVTEEMQRGYRLGDRVLRPSMVKVASNQKETISDED